MDPSDLTLFAAALLVFALVSRRVERGVLTPPMAFTAFGFAAGAGGLGLMAAPVEGEALNTLAEITLTLILFTDASRINVSRLGRQHSLPMRLLGLGLPLTVAAGAGAGLWLLGLDPWSAALLGAILAPTDAALGQAVVNDERTPLRVRQALNVESGLNDGLAFPAVLIFLSLAGAAEARGAGDWALFVGLQLVVGPLAGLAVGGLGGLLAERLAEAGWVNRVFLQISALSLALLAYGAAELAHGNGFIAAFVAGLVTGVRSETLKRPLEDFGEVEAQLLSLVVFITFGALMLPPALEALSWPVAAYALLSLTLIRMVPVALSLVGSGLAPASYLYLGWFGPRGLASILYLLLIVEEAGLTTTSPVYVAIVVTVSLSILLHGLTARPLAGLYGRRIEGRAGPEHAEAPIFATRPPRAREEA